MKNILLIISFMTFVTIMTSCNNDATVHPPLTEVRVLMAEVTADSIISPAGFTSQITKSLGSGPLNFIDRDSVVVALSYRGTPGNTSTYSLEIWDSTSAISHREIYLLRSVDVTTGLRTETFKAKSDRANGYYFYRMTASGPTDQSFYIYDLRLYKE